jgi:hypothetical protein
MSSIVQESLLEKFARYHRNNPLVYALFKQFAERLIARGLRKTSAWLIMNRIRWEINVETYGDEFKICNDYFALYARLFIAERPEHRDLFNIKRMKPGNEPSVDWLLTLVPNG